MDEKFPRGLELLHNPTLNKGTAFTDAERDALGLHGLLPPHVQTEEEQLERVLANLRRKPAALERYIFLIALLDRNETLFYRTIIDNVEEMLPLIYTPTVGQACQEFSQFSGGHAGSMFRQTIEDAWPKCCKIGRTGTFA